MRAGVTRALRGFAVELPDFHQSVRFELETAEDGESALARLERGPVDLLLLDHKLPGIQGLDVLHKLAEEKRDMVTIMITAYASIETAVSATKQGAFDFLAKPFTPVELRATVEKATGHLFVQRHARKLELEKRQLRFQLISVVAHELKSPLAVIESYLMLLKEPGVAADPAQSGHFVDRAVARLGGMRKLIADLLDLTRIESGRKKRELAPTDLVKVAGGCLEVARRLGAEREIAVHMQAPAELVMVADSGEIEIILNTLLTNAIKYNVPGGRVDLELGERGGDAVLSVRDTGIGMSPEERARLFQEFVRIKNSKTRNISGSGLGLSIVKKLAALYGGTVMVESEPGSGSTFTVALPLRAGQQAPAEAPGE